MKIAENRIFRPLACIAFALAAVCGAAQAAPEITSAEPTYDFGAVDNEKKVEHDFVVKNIGDEPLEIARVKTSCGCTVADLKKKTLAPGEETTISATLSNKGKQGPQTKNLTVESNDPKQPFYRLQMTGVALADVTVTPRSLNFGRIIDNDSHAGVVTVDVEEGSRPIKVIGVESSNDVFDTEIKEVEPGGKYEVVVSTPENMPAGYQSSRLVISTDDRDNKSILVNVMAQVVGDLEISPQQIMLRESADPNDATSQYMRVAAGRVKDFEIVEVVPPSSQMEIEVQQRADNDYLVKLGNMPLDGSLEGKELIIKTDIEGNPEIRVPFQMMKLPQTVNRRR